MTLGQKATARRIANANTSGYKNVKTDFSSLVDQIANGEQSFKYSDGVQLIKHAFGLRTEAQLKKKSPVLVYLYAEPAVWPDGRSIPVSSLNSHAQETSEFADQVEGAEVIFRTCTYRNLLETFLRSASAWERSGATMSAPFAGVHLVEATKQVYRAIPVREKKLVPTLKPVLKPVLAPSPGGAALRQPGRSHRVRAEPAIGPAR